VPSDDFGADAGATVEAYAGEARAMAFAAGWFAVALLGRVLFIAAVRRAMHDSGSPNLLLDLAFGAMVISVAVEIVSTSLPAAAAWLAGKDGDRAAILALDAAASMTFVVIFPIIGVSVLATSLAMVAERLFPPWVRWLGVAAGVLLAVGGTAAASTVGDPDNRELGQQGVVIGALLLWLWMLVSSIVLWRSRPGAGERGSPRHEPASAGAPS
jgi:hypothetical protein